MDVLKISLSGSVIILIILALRAALLNKLPKGTFTALWIIAVFALLMPFPFKTPVSLKNLQLKHSEQNAVYGQTANAEETADYAALDYTAQSSAEDKSGAQTADIPFMCWAAGAAIISAYFIVRYKRALKLFKTSLPTDNEYVRQWLDKHKLRREVEVRVSDKISSPLTYGVIKPVILLPKSLNDANRNALNYVLAHEFIHIKHFDSLYKFVLAAALALHWFNPLVWLMFMFASRDLELACDEAVLIMHGTQTRKTYALLLIDLEEKKAELNALCSGFGAASIKKRIKNIMKIKKKTVAAIVASGLIIGGLTTAYAAVSPTADNDFFTVTSVETGEDSYVLDMTQYDEYAPWGIEYDGEKDMFFYNGERVKLFEDSVEIEPGMVTSKCSYYDPDGDVCIRTLRRSEENDDGSINPFGKITGIKELSQKEIKELIDIHTDYGVSQYTYVIENDAIETSQAQSGEYSAAYSEVSVDDYAEQTQLADKYKNLGLKYSFNGEGLKMSFNGKNVHALYDEVEGIWIANNMHGYNLDEAVDLEAVYENGKLAALDVKPCTHKGQAYAFAGEGALYSYSVTEEDALVTGDSSVSYETTWEQTASEDAGDFSAAAETAIAQTTDATISDGAVYEGTPLPDMFDRYKKYGVEYKESKAKNGDTIRNLYYNGTIINHFADVKPDGSVFTFGSSEQSSEGVNIGTVYKNGRLAGVGEIKTADLP